MPYTLKKTQSTAPLLRYVMTGGQVQYRREPSDIGNGLQEAEYVNFNTEIDINNMSDADKFMLYAETVAALVEATYSDSEEKSLLRKKAFGLPDPTGMLDTYNSLVEEFKTEVKGVLGLS